MTEKLLLGQQVSVAIDRNREIKESLDIVGKFHVKHYNKDGNLKNVYDLKNAIKNAAKDLLLNVMFGGTAPVTTWYIRLIDAAGWTAEAASDTLASHTGWVEFINYTGSGQEWTEGAASAGAITNAVALTFPIIAIGSLKGIFVASAASGTVGTLWSTADFPSAIAVADGDSFKITYSVSL